MENWVREYACANNMVLRKKVIGRNGQINELDPEKNDSEIAEPDRGMDGWASMFAAVPCAIRVEVHNIPCIGAGAAGRRRHLMHQQQGEILRG